MTEQPDPLWTLKDLAAFLSVTEASARKIISRGQLPPGAVIRVGSRIRLRAAVLKEWIEKA